MLDAVSHDFRTVDPLAPLTELLSALAAGPLEASGSEFQARPAAPQLLEGNGAPSRPSCQLAMH